MKKSLSKSEASNQIENFFSEIKFKSQKDIKKIKKLASSYKIPLKDNRKTFCKKCLSAYISPKIRIKNGKKIIECENCASLSRWELK